MQTHEHKMVDEVEESLIQQMVSKYAPFWPIFLVALLVAAAIAFTYIQFAIPKYEANATLIIKDEKKGNEDSKEMEELDILSSKKIVENEIEILQSRTLITNVVKALYLYAPIYEEGQIQTLSAYTRSPVLIEAPDADSLQGVDRVEFSFDKNSQTVILDSKHKYG